MILRNKHHDLNKEQPSSLSMEETNNELKLLTSKELHLDCSRFFENKLKANTLTANYYHFQASSTSISKRAQCIMTTEGGGVGEQ